MRIPRPAPGRAKIWLLATVALIVATVIATWWGLAATVGKPSWQDVAWDVKDERTIDVKYRVTRPQDMTVVCVIEAQAENHAVVGTLTVTIGPSDRSEVVQTSTLRTTNLAVRGGVRTCRDVTAADAPARGSGGSPT